MDFEWSRRDDKHVRVKERPVLDPNARPILSDFRDELAALGFDVVDTADGPKLRRR